MADEGVIDFFKGGKDGLLVMEEGLFLLGFCGIELAEELAASKDLLEEIAADLPSARSFIEEGVQSRAIGPIESGEVDLREEGGSCNADIGIRGDQSIFRLHDVGAHGQYFTREPCRDGFGKAPIVKAFAPDNFMRAFAQQYAEKVF